MSDIDAQRLFVSQLFGGSYTFHIPAYQRPYSWKVEQTRQLFEDLADQLDPTRTLNEHEPYFLGSVVLIQRDENSTAREVVDGQQRITTLSLLMIALRERLGGKLAASLGPHLEQPADDLRDIPSQPRVHLRARDREFYASRILAAGPGDQKQDLAQLEEAQANLWNNLRTLCELAAGLDDAKASLFAKYLVNRCVLVSVTTKNFDAAYQIFTVLNNRGLALSPTDILTSKLLGGLPEHQIPKFTERWESMEGDLGFDAFNDLFVHLRMVHGKQKLRVSLLKAWEELLVGRDPAKFLKDELEPSADAYLVVTRAQYEATHHAEAVNTVLRALGRVDNSDWVPVAIVAYRRWHAEPKRLLDVLTDLERLAMSMLIRRVYINDRITRYGGVLQAIEDGTDLSAGTSPLQLTADERAATVRELDGNLYDHVRVRLPVLLRLNEFIAHDAHIYVGDNPTVEHVLPQNPDPNGPWLADFPDEAQRRALTHRLGNLLLLSRRKNSAANNRAYAVKKTGYFAGASVTSFPLTTHVLQEPVWTPAVIERRQQELLGKLREQWRL